MVPQSLTVSLYSVFSPLPQASFSRQSTQPLHFSRQYLSSIPARQALYISCIAQRQQPNETTQAVVTENWTRLILTYARYRRLFVLRVEDAETTGGDWDEVLRNERINRASHSLLIPFCHESDLHCLRNM